MFLIWCEFKWINDPEIIRKPVVFDLSFLSWIFTIHKTEGGEGKAISLTPLYHFYPLHRDLDISPVITAESSPLRIVSFWSRTGNLGFRAQVANHCIMNMWDSCIKMLAKFSFILLLILLTTFFVILQCWTSK